MKLNRPHRDAASAAEQSVHTCSLSVRSYECDSYGHVNNAVYLHYLEYARHEYLRDIGVSIPELRESGYGLLVAKVSIEYRRPRSPMTISPSPRPRCGSRSSAEC